MTTKKANRRANIMDTMGLSHVPGVKSEIPKEDIPSDIPEEVLGEEVSAQACEQSPYTPDQMRVIDRALEVYARLGMGQLDILTGLAHEGRIPLSESIPDGMKAATLTCFDQLMDEARINMGYETFADISIFADEVHDDCKLAWDLHRSIQNPGNTDEKAYKARSD